MSTIPTEILEATEPALDIASIKSLMDGFDPAALLPDLSALFGSLATLCRVAVMIGPVVLLILGLAYLFLAPREANYYFGYRCYFGMGSVQAWKYTHKLAGRVWGGLGAVLTLVAIIVAIVLGGKEPADAMNSALTMLIIEAVCALLAFLAVEILVFVRYDMYGNLKNKKR